MTVFRDEANGSYFVSFYLKDPNRQGKYKHITKRGFSSKKDAAKWESDNANQTPTEETFIDICHKWETMANASKGTIRQHNEHFRIRFGQYKDIPIRRITKQDLTDWKTWLSEQPFSTKTKNTTITYVKGVFRFASDNYDIPNPSQVLTKFKKTDTEILNAQDEDIHVWTPEEFDLFMAAVEDGCYRLYFEFLYWTGARRGEGIALQKKDLKDGYAFIRGSKRYQQEVIRTTKTKKARKVQLDNRLYLSLKAYSELTDGDYVFGGTKSLSPSSIARRFKKGIDISGVNPIRLHDLRHSHATWLINNGVNIVAVSKRLGHSSINETLKTYTHLLESTDQNMMQKINEFRVRS